MRVVVVIDDVQHNILWSHTFYLAFFSLHPDNALKIQLGAPKVISLKKKKKKQKNPTSTLSLSFCASLDD